MLENKKKKTLEFQSIEETEKDRENANVINMDVRKQFLLQC